MTQQIKETLTPLLPAQAPRFEGFAYQVKHTQTHNKHNTLTLHQQDGKGGKEERRKGEKEEKESGKEKKKEEEETKEGGEEGKKGGGGGEGEEPQIEENHSSNLNQLPYRFLSPLCSFIIIFSDFPPLPPPTTTITDASYLPQNTPLYFN